MKKNQNIYNIIDNQEFKLSGQAHIAVSKNQGQVQETNVEDFSHMVRQISIDKL